MPWWRCQKAVPSGLPRAQDASRPSPSQGEEALEEKQHFPVARDWNSNCPLERETIIQLISAPALRVDLWEAARNLPGVSFLALVCKWHLDAFLARGRFLLNSGSGETGNPATLSPSNEVYLITHADPPLCSASGGFAISCTPCNARAVTSSVKPSEPRGSQPPLEPPLPRLHHPHKTQPGTH